MKKLYILFALCMCVALFAGCKDKEVFADGSQEQLSSITATSSESDDSSELTVSEGAPITPPTSSFSHGMNGETASFLQGGASSTTQTPQGSSSQTVTDGDDWVSAGDFLTSSSSSETESGYEPETESAPSAPAQTNDPSSSSSLPEVAPVSSSAELWSPYY